MKVESVWFFDVNHREYTTPSDPVRVWGDLIWRRHWRQIKVIGETSRSWVLNNGVKLPKKGAWPSNYVLTDAEVDDRVWVHDYRFKIDDAVRRCNHAGTLRRVAELVGYVPEEPK